MDRLTLSGIYDDPEYRYILEIIRHGDTTVDDKDGPLKIPEYLTKKNKWKALKQLLDDGELTFDACGQTEFSTMLNHFTPGDAEHIRTQLSVLEHIGSTWQQVTHQVGLQIFLQNHDISASLTPALCRGFPNLARAVMTTTECTSQAVQIAAAHGCIDWLTSELPQYANRPPDGYNNWCDCLRNVLPHAMISRDAWNVIYKVGAINDDDVLALSSEAQSRGYPPIVLETNPMVQVISPIASASGKVVVDSNSSASNTPSTSTDTSPSITFSADTGIAPVEMDDTAADVAGAGDIVDEKFDDSKTSEFPCVFGDGSGAAVRRVTASRSKRRRENDAVIHRKVRRK
jgi:hypothetical protein